MASAAPKSATNDAVLIIEATTGAPEAGIPYLHPKKTPFKVNRHRQIPDGFIGVDSVVIVGMADASVVKQNI